MSVTFQANLNRNLNFIQLSMFMYEVQKVKSLAVAVGIIVQFSNMLTDGFNCMPDYGQQINIHSSKKRIN